MSSPVISVSNLSKFYRLGMIGGGTIREDFGRWWAKARGRPDPTLKIGDEKKTEIRGQMSEVRDPTSDLRPPTSFFQLLFF
jgi:lipopolysaccharide transport system ATP-binding protein